VSGFVIKHLGLLPYQQAYQLQLETHNLVASAETPPTLLLLEHERVVTHGRKDEDETNLVVPKAMLEAQGIDVINTERGGTVTYHGPGQLVAYAIFPVGRRVRDFLRRLENVQIRLLKTYGVFARPNPGYAGVYVGEDKIGSIGVAIKRNVALHGLAINLNTQLEDFNLIVPCGLTDTKMTSLAKILKQKIDMQDARDRLENAFVAEFKDYHWLEELAGQEVSYA
jgi:lipoyl(octanoyl) transferase